MLTHLHRRPLPRTLIHPAQQYWYKSDIETKAEQDDTINRLAQRAFDCGMNVSTKELLAASPGVCKIFADKLQGK